MTTEKYLQFATRLLSRHSIGTARLDSLILMEHVLGLDRAKLLASPQTEITVKQKNVLNKLLERRATHTPISYITHSKEFYGRTFYINEYVLEPRPESEAIIDGLKYIVIHERSYQEKDQVGSKLHIADIGTGSGALGITAALEIKNASVDLLDIDKDVLKVAKRNVVIHTIDAHLIQADLLVNINKDYDILLCNLPYVPDDLSINLAAGHEPRIAIFGGQDGLDLYRKLFNIVSCRQHMPLYIITESLPPAHDTLKQIAKQSSYELFKVDGFVQVFKLAA